MMRFRANARFPAREFDAVSKELSDFFTSYEVEVFHGSDGRTSVLRGAIGEEAWTHQGSVTVATNGDEAVLSADATFIEGELQLPSFVARRIPGGLPTIYVCAHPRRAPEMHIEVFSAFVRELEGVAAVREVAYADLPPSLVDAGVQAGHVACKDPQIRLTARVVETDPTELARSVTRRLIERSPFTPAPAWLAQAEQLLLGGPSDEYLLEEATHLEDQAAQLKDELEAAIFNYDVANEELERALMRLAKLEGENRFLRNHLRQLNEFVYDIPEDEPPTSVAEAIERAQAELGYLEFGPDSAQFKELDRHEKSAAWAIEVWRALLALDGFARAQQADRQSSNFVRYLDDPPSEEWPIFDSSRVAMQESDSTMNDARCAAARDFNVPTSVDESGVVSMVAHVKIARGGRPCPRIHFWDDTKGVTKKVHVGHIGDHLPIPGYS